MIPERENSNSQNLHKLEDLQNIKLMSDPSNLLIVSEVNHPNNRINEPNRIAFNEYFSQPNDRREQEKHVQEYAFKRMPIEIDVINSTSILFKQDSNMTAKTNFEDKSKSVFKNSFVHANSLGYIPESQIFDSKILSVPSTNSFTFAERNFNFENDGFVTINIKPNEIESMEKGVGGNGESKKESKTSRCTCKKSYCLRLYCDCFSKGLLCGSDCACSGCHNNSDNIDIRDTMMKETIEKNPLAFSSKYKKLKNDEKILHSRGCNCSKTGCVKKYCECFNAGTGCSRLCRCTNCKNEEIEIKDSEIKVYYEKVLRKRRKHSAFGQLWDSKLDGNKKEIL